MPAITTHFRIRGLESTNDVRALFWIAISTTLLSSGHCRRIPRTASLEVPPGGQPSFWSGSLMNVYLCYDLAPSSLATVLRWTTLRKGSRRIGRPAPVSRSLSLGGLTRRRSSLLRFGTIYLPSGPLLEDPPEGLPGRTPEDKSASGNAPENGFLVRLYNASQCTKHVEEQQILGQVEMTIDSLIDF